MTNPDYLVQRFAGAQEKLGIPSDAEYLKYWTGVQDAFMSTLNDAFPGWCKPGTVGWWVVNEGMTYDAALAAAHANSPHGWSTYAGDDADATPEDFHWKNSTTWDERRTITDDDEW